METPPRAWGRLVLRLFCHLAVGNTPTGVGKTIEIGCEPECIEKHPHGRGEDDKMALGMVADQETPPRAWGRPGRYVRVAHGGRNTPTGVGKTAGARA